MIKASDYVFNFLKSKDIDTIFTVAGGAAAHLLNSVVEGNWKYICNYHEQACAMAAEGYARIANKPAIVLVTNGPGSSNTLTGVLGAYQDSIPMIVISGQVPINQSLGSLKDIKLRQLGVQECDIISMVSPITKYAVQITDPKDIRYHLEKAYYESVNGRQGPVWLDIPLDVQSANIDPTSLSSFTPPPPSVDFDVNYDEILSLILKSKKPLIVTGNGIHLSKSEKIFSKLIQHLKIPIVSTWTSKDLLSQDDTLFVGNFGILGERAANFAIQNADLLLVLGSRLSIPNTGYQSQLFSPNSIKIVVDIDINELDKPSLKIDYPIHSDLSIFLTLLSNKLEKTTIPTWNKWVNITQEWKQKYPVFQPEYKLNTHKINSFYLMEVLSPRIQDNIIVTDMGTSYTCTMQSLQMNGRARLFTSSACCSMGFGLPGAIGAYFADPTKEIILIVGDGGLQMNLQELQTIVHYNIPIKMFVLNNNGYLAISLMQNNLFNKNYIGSNPQSGVSSPDFVKISNAYGLKNYKLNNNKQLEDNIDQILQLSEPVLVEVMMPEDQLLVPRVQSSKDENGNILSNSLENMYPYLPAEEMKSIMSWKY